MRIGYAAILVAVLPAAAHAQAWRWGITRTPIRQGPQVVWTTPRMAGGWYLDRNRQWRHDGGLNPDTNYPERKYLQLEDPEGVYARTKGREK